MKMILMVSFALFTGIAAEARVQYMNVFNGTYPGSAVGQKARCQTCHLPAGKPLNPYGRDFYQFVLRAEFRGANFNLIEHMDSDGDGVTNLDEILNARHPGDKNH
jgi:hypothetical protein